VPCYLSFGWTMESSTPPQETAADAHASSALEAVGKGQKVPPPSDQMRVSGTGRRKVALPPGRSQLDWIRNSRALMLPSPRRYTLGEVRTHRQRGDAWTVVRGMVFNITPYLEYHPGGLDMIMAGAGKVSCLRSTARSAMVLFQFGMV
jgi:hypothetical protein